MNNMQTVRPGNQQKPVAVQDQRSLTEQLQDLVILANKNGLYDAADYLHQILKRRSPRA
jgi:hypothetical protein